MLRNKFRGLKTLISFCELTLKELILKSRFLHQLGYILQKVKQEVVT